MWPLGIFMSTESEWCLYYSRTEIDKWEGLDEFFDSSQRTFISMQDAISITYKILDIMSKLEKMGN